ncbi:glycosyltransferase [Corynebacterium sp. HS2168-gen11]|uniref:glycosyltransferase n=1 Tax=Corynebacterium sp. HS2168-gen11 TaxID=2974027 RepID=UPI00216B3E4F|nr:glycosyltransferase [Corynebacterium sp. HS2168-gen11]MCS4535602.1 glycosyltransferase [Corynebacterium sp. HS2168-gen11]
MATVSALVSVYHRVQPEELRLSLASLLSQTHPLDAIVIVEDGPLSPKLQQVIGDHVEQSGGIARTVVLAMNQGAGPARRAGINTIDTDFVAILDADDIAADDRIAKQLAFFAAHPQLDVVGTAVAEFEDDPRTSTNVRVLPADHAAIARYAKMNSPINNPSVMMRTAKVKEVGNYRDVHHMEDYDLFARLLAHGAKFANMPEPLTFFRVTPAQFQRRTGSEMLQAEWRMQRNLYAYGLISWPRVFFNVLVRTTYRLLPKAALHRVYAMLFHAK